jgi:BirA family biotin operon repressor/biotin-[acetyl-CoA-carboxylase] ligase
MNEVEISRRIKSEVFGKLIRVYDAVDSTNLRAIELIKGGEEEGTLVIAEEQTAGRGRRGKAWFSEKGKNLLFSLIIKPCINRDSLSLTSLTAALSVAKAVQTLYGLPVECKWPNDVMAGSKKFCGILPETVLREGDHPRISLGIGINVNQKIFPAEIAERTVSLSMLTGKELDRYELLAEVLQHLENNFRRLGEGYKREILDEWIRFSFHFGREVSINVDGQVINGIAEDVAEDGSLIIRSRDEKIKIISGDVSYDTRI